MDVTLAIVLTSIAITSTVIILSARKWLAHFLIVVGLIGLYISAMQVNVRFFIVFLSFSLAFIVSGIILIIANAKFKKAYK